MLFFAICGTPLDQIMPKTLTELYTKLVLNLILRNLRKVSDSTSDSKFGLSLNNFDLIPDHLKIKFWFMCKFAYTCLSNDQIVFTETELSSFFPEGRYDEFLCFGLLQTAKSLLPVGHALSFHFLHLTIQEYLAALHFTTLSLVEKKEFCKFQARNSHFSMFWRFAFGLGCKKSEYIASNKINYFDDALVDLFISEVVTHEPGVTTDFFPLSGICVIPKDQPLLLCHCAMESNSSTFSTKVAKQIDRRFMTRVRTPFDCLAVCRVLKHSSQSTVDISMSSCGLSDKHLKELTGVLTTKAGRLTVKNLSLEVNNITEVGLNNLFKGGAACLDSLEFLFLKGNKLKDFARIFNHSFLNNLKWLSLSNNPLGEKGINHLANAFAIFLWRIGSKFDPSRAMQYIHC